MDRIRMWHEFKKHFFSSTTSSTICLIYRIMSKCHVLENLIVMNAYLTRMENFQNASDTNWDTERTLVRLGPSAQVSIKHLNVQRRALTDSPSQDNIFLTVVLYIQGRLDWTMHTRHEITTSHTRKKKKIRKEPEKYRSPSKMDWNCVKKEFLLKTCTKTKMVRSFIWPPVMVPLRQTEVSNVDQKLHPASHCPASAGSVCWELQRGTEMFLCSCSLHGWWQETHTDTLL